MTQGENKEVSNYDKRNDCSDSSDKLCGLKIKNKIEDEIGIISTLKNDTKINAETALEVNNEYGIISTFRAKQNKKTEERKMKRIISMLAETKKRTLVSIKSVR